MATVLGIDTSCDDTGVGVVRDGRVLANVVESQTALHARFGGVVPEQASREHLSVLDGVVARALDEAGTPLEALDAVAATRGPGLVGALLVGLAYGKALAWGRGLPFVAVHHLEAHIAAAVAGTRLSPPFLCLIASGGHTVLYLVRSWDRIEQLGASRDDAAGEAFDKVARLLGLGYPGGPALAALAERGDDRAVKLPMPMERQQGFDFSFSGLKTAVAIVLEREPDADRADVAASFERTVVDALMGVATRAVAHTGVARLVVAGGVAANARLRERLRSSGLEVAFPPPALATDNGAMVALAGERLLPRARGRQAEILEADAAPYLPLTGTLARSASS
ncbi:MAG TPA: tRNA (adenosine(37)-N6)-threonylcarbamoyltransferase complex transferase subunit TsaD [Trueperaceae bacterium]|nr:tRNA (adenosine(37)-N6)-threonylcarbamoyltransferase complex transferase subunit TsaD [Trueperaceae bacterium]